MLKLIAAILMLIDHIGATLLPSYFILRIIGRLSFPIFAYIVAKGAKRTKDLDIYISRIIIFALASQIPFVYFGYRLEATGIGLVEFAYKSYLPGIAFFAPPAMAGHPGLNVGFTFAFALMAIKLLERAKIDKNNKVEVGLNYIGIFAMMLLAFFLHTDYAAYGVAMVLVFYNFSVYKKDISAKMVYILPLLINISVMIIQLFTLFSIPLIRRFDEVKPNILPRWAFYAFYPVHMLILGFIMRNYF